MKRSLLLFCRTRFLLFRWISTTTLSWAPVRPFMKFSGSNSCIFITSQHLSRRFYHYHYCLYSVLAIHEVFRFQLLHIWNQPTPFSPSSSFIFLSSFSAGNSLKMFGNEKYAWFAGTKVDNFSFCYIILSAIPSIANCTTSNCFHLIGFDDDQSISYVSSFKPLFVWNWYDIHVWFVPQWSCCSWPVLADTKDSYISAITPLTKR